MCKHRHRWSPIPDPAGWAWQCTRERCIDQAVIYCFATNCAEKEVRTARCAAHAPVAARADKETQARDAALDLLEAYRAVLIATAEEIAENIWRKHGEVSASEVWVHLRERAETDDDLADKLDSADPRWMGAVFREDRGWTRLRWENTGSHKRPVPVWTRRT